MNDTLLKPERHLEICHLLEADGRVTVLALSEHFEVSEATIRRDLEELDQKGLLQRTHGGAIKVGQPGKEPPILQRLTVQASEKQAIAAAAALLLRENQTIFLGSGSTVLELARRIPETMELTVITNSLPVIKELTSLPKIELIVIGGMLRQSEQSMIGHIAEHGIREFRADRVFIGMRSIDVVHGFTNDYLPEILTDRAILSIASQVSIVADHTKFGRISPVYLGPITAADLIITDGRTEQAILEEIQSSGVEILQV